MGKEVEQAALSMGHEIVSKTSSGHTEPFTQTELNGADVAIEFTQPASAVEIIIKCLNSGMPIVTGTTGWYDRLEEVKEMCRTKNGTVLYASNFSIGVNLFFELNSRLAALMRAREEYEVSLEEIHHIQKLDKPSGTAITLASEIINGGIKKEWALSEGEENKKDVLYINSIRQENVIGTHIVKYKSVIDELEIRHHAFSRKGFARGAVLAAQWLAGKKGFFEMKDFLKEL